MSYLDFDAIDPDLGPRCGRIDEHPAHEWIARGDWPYMGVIVKECPGSTVIEGGHFVSCDECGEHVDHDHAANTCGAHRLHLRCQPFFRCRECDYVREVLAC